MRIQGHLFTWLAVFLLAVAAVYGLWSQEPVGTTALFLSFALSAMIGFYLIFTARRVDVGAQDNKDADVADDAGEVGFFSPHSWAPLLLGAGAALAFLGPVFGWWFLIFTIPVMFIGLWLWVFEYYRGENQTQ
ncbi:cytochrome c oxidase subunit 4 [Streptomyces sp. 3MP-14]|uniref:Cytochrome c oxidase polypeptide 4 n=1 Tax=Streptomyces mimosae TaxID=2586635 RepID=A0A5N6AIG0_9ACTN|nr:MULTISPECIES: cytochrome c oxidase subunit 4 [Streptomyces]KAB8168617.1 cytochrome c oxidase subunit 4 [Streptomyces mimosae]KAB8178103.1 cytochrome c oxidase subunit 4 [Streptomyces sp. 3MP-14]